jgi:hypothetical protein
VVSTDFKSVMPRDERGRWVRLPRTPANDFSFNLADPDTAKADAGELTSRMSGYDRAIPLMYPEMSEEQSAAMPVMP